MSLQDILDSAKAIGRGSHAVARGGYTAFEGMASLYRHSLDPIKPSIDRVVDPAAVFLGSNLLLSQAVYHANHLAVQPGMQRLLGDEGYAYVRQVLDSNSYLDGGIKAAILGAVYGLANWKLIFPAMRKAWQRKTKPGWLNHLKTWAIVGASLLAFNSSDLQDEGRTAHSGYKANSSRPLSKAAENHNALKILEQYAMGEKTADMARDMARYGTGMHDSISAVSRWVGESIDRHVEDHSERRLAKRFSEIEEKVKSAQLEKSAGSKGFAYTDDVSKVANKYVKQGYFRTPEEFAYLVRLVYFEGACDPAAGKNLKKIKKGMHGIASVVHNRWVYEKATSKKLFTAVSNPTLSDIANHRYAFTCIADNPDYFINHPGKPGWDMYGRDGLQIAVGDMDKSRTDLAYEAVIDILEGKGKRDPTRRSLYYKNPKQTSEHTNANWKRWGMNTININEHSYFIPRDMDKRLSDEMIQQVYSGLMRSTPGQG